MMPNHNEEKMERLIHQTLRALPPRRAPATLETRVRTEIQRQAALPWWRKSFAHWPLAARAGFIVLSAGLGKGALMLGMWIMAGFDTSRYQAALTETFAWMESGRTVVQAITGFFDIMARSIPPLWLYGGLAFFAAMYATLFGLGAAAYKAFRPQS